VADTSFAEVSTRNRVFAWEIHQKFMESLPMGGEMMERRTCEDLAATVAGKPSVLTHVI
jgi:hypothetical protein